MYIAKQGITTHQPLISLKKTNGVALSGNQIWRK